MEHSPEFEQIVNQLRPLVKEFSIAEYLEWAKDNDHILIDVREDREWQKGHLPHAIHIGKGVIERDIHVFVEDKSQQLVLYCGGGYRSVLASYNLGLMGYHQTHSLDGGWRGWKAADLPIEQGD